MRFDHCLRTCAANANHHDADKHVLKDALFIPVVDIEDVQCRNEKQLVVKYISHDGQAQQVLETASAKARNILVEQVYRVCAILQANRFEQAGGRGPGPKMTPKYTPDIGVGKNG